MPTPYMFVTKASFDENGKAQFPTGYDRLIGTQINGRNTEDAQTGFRFIVAYNSLTDDYDYTSVSVDASGEVTPLDQQLGITEAAWDALEASLPASIRITNIDSTSYAALFAAWSP